MPEGRLDSLVQAAQSAVENAKRAARARVGSSTPPRVPGVPSAVTPSLEEPTEPHEPAPPKPDQGAPERRTATGAATDVAATALGQQGAYLTTAHGARLAETDHALKAGRRGPTLLQDHHLREKVSHFDHERIPERAVHARGAGAHGVFVGYGNADSICRAPFLGEGVETEVFVRFSTVVGSRGSADTARDTRGFATKFYTGEGTWDLVGNNIPVFFIQEGIKFPDLVHAAKPSPDREIPQAQSAHDSFWDFVSLHTEAQHHTLWNMSDRGLARSYRMMEGFGVHTFRCENADGATSLVKFHWKPVLGVHSLTWEEAQMTNGVDPDFHRRDLADAIEAGAHPQWELGVQVLPDTADETFEGIDLLDSSKLVPEELAPVQPIGMMTLTRNPTNYFAETEQVAFNPSNLVPGIDVTNDPLMQARLFSYLDTQITRLGGPNWSQLPINRPHADVNDMLRDGQHQSAVHAGAAPYHPNSLDGGCPFHAGAGDARYVDLPVAVSEGRHERALPASYDDHFSQPRLFWRSMSPVEQEHIINAYSFELAKVFEQSVKERQLRALANIDARLCSEVATAVGLPAPEPTVELRDVEPSAALSQIGATWPVDGRVVGIVVDADGDLGGVQEIADAVHDAGAVPLVVAAHGGTVGDGITVQRVLAATRSVEFDALVVTGFPTPAPDAQPARDSKAAASTSTLDPRVELLLAEALRHDKAVAAFGADTRALDVVGADASTPGVVLGDGPGDVAEALLSLMAAHRAWERHPVG